MLSPAERVIVGNAVRAGFVSADDLTSAQRRIAKELQLRAILHTAGEETSGVPVYRATEKGRKLYEQWG